jgi:hypothetical protein
MEKETLDEAAERHDSDRDSFISGANWQAQRMYSRQDIIDFVYFINSRHFNRYTVDTDEVDLFIEQFKKG